MNEEKWIENNELNEGEGRAHAHIRTLGGNFSGRTIGSTSAFSGSNVVTYSYNTICNYQCAVLQLNIKL